MSRKTTDWEAIRNEFPILQQTVNGFPLVYLDNAATSQKPLQVLDALDRFYRRDNSNVHRGIHELSRRATVAFEAARDRAARFLNASESAEIVFTRGTTESINLVAYSWGAKYLKAGDTILLTEMEHHSNIVPWQLLAARAGAKLAYVPVTGDDGLLDLSRLDALFDSTVKLFAFTHVSNSLGTVNPAAELCERARKRGIVTLVDAAQSAGHRPVDVREIGCDFLAFSGHKLCGPTGSGVLYGRRQLLEEMPPFQGGGDMIATVDFFHSTWKEVPHKFEAGTPDFAAAIGLRAALDYISAIGCEKIARHDEELAALAMEKISRLRNIRVFGPQKGHAGVVSFLMRNIHAHDVVTVADQRGVALRGGHHCNQPLMKKLGIESTARASFYFYNTPAEIDRLVEVLAEIKTFFGE
ncbi:MAG TPA: cysteine desulfurase [Candidatus Saccharimonadales bacterium]|nr:cysteine desulfurase [Candidatus Saccharimonadales bacterium]